MKDQAGWFCKNCHDTHHVLYQEIVNNRKMGSYCFRCLPEELKDKDTMYVDQIGNEVEKYVE